MQITRRDLAVAGALALGVPSLLFGSPAFAEAGDEAAVKQNVETFREALLKADKAQLERLTADQLSYGHSDGRVQNKPEFIDGVMTRKATVKSLSFPDLKIEVAGDAAIARHLYEVRNPKWTAKLPIPGSALSRSGRSRAGTGSFWRGRHTSLLERLGQLSSDPFRPE